MRRKVFAWGYLLAVLALSAFVVYEAYLHA